MIVKVSSSSLRNGRWYEYLVRFVLGGAATVFTGLIGSRFGPSIGGLFLALPAIFCASATLIEKHEIRRKRKAGTSGQTRGRQAAALDAAGAAIGSIGMLVFALIFWLLVERYATTAFVLALSAWGGMSVLMWWIWRHFRVSTHASRASKPANANSPACNCRMCPR
ncbi:DUF3147 family protein [Bradyrhizobium sp. CCGUVB23]|uniref:DUF3147 family protein n=1 Tax=Bradyrhizobium sp. CCGUVB23 TaxID=2949630 RepID=UPI0020B3E909|nr:DUF3147 family protein [Bradyrhizobium sp. CCGUVB23]MCP3459614.1 DUF3147 family protein [Bradyrhizobium sp. CCGUVB23]